MTLVTVHYNFKLTLTSVDFDPVQIKHESDL